MQDTPGKNLARDLQVFELVGGKQGWRKEMSVV
jgi:hypothetical protein